MLKLTQGQSSGIKGHRQVLDVGSKGDQLQQLLVLVNRVTFLPHATTFHPVRLFTLRKGTSFEKTRHHHFHILLNAVQPDNVDKVKRDAGLLGASHSYVDAARASLAKSLHGCSWGFWVLVQGEETWDGG